MRILPKRIILSVAKTIVQEKHQVNGLRERKRSIDVLDVLEDYIVENGKPNKVMHDNGKQFTSKVFKRFLKKNRG